MFSNKQTKKNDLMVQQRINAVNNFSSNNSWYNIRHTCVHQKTERRENWEKIKREPEPKKKIVFLADRTAFISHSSKDWTDLLATGITWALAWRLWPAKFEQQQNRKTINTTQTYEHTRKKNKKKRRRNAGQCDSMEWPIILHSIFHCFMLCPFACYRTWIIVRKTRSGVFYCWLYSCLLSIVTEEFRVRNIHTKLIQKKTMQMLNKPQQSKVVTSAELLHRTSRNFITDTD